MVTWLRFLFWALDVSDLVTPLTLLTAIALFSCTRSNRYGFIDDSVISFVHALSCRVLVMKMSKLHLFPHFFVPSRFHGMQCLSLPFRTEWER